MIFQSVPISVGSQRLRIELNDIQMWCYSNVEWFDYRICFRFFCSKYFPLSLTCQISCTYMDYKSVTFANAKSCNTSRLNSHDHTPCESELCRNSSNLDFKNFIWMKKKTLSKRYLFFVIYQLNYDSFFLSVILNMTPSVKMLLLFSSCVFLILPDISLNTLVSLRRSRKFERYFFKIQFGQEPYVCWI